MARPTTVSDTDIFEACDAILEEQGSIPTNHALLTRLGRGSGQTIQKGRLAWISALPDRLAKAERPPMELPEEIGQEFMTVYKKLERHFESYYAQVKRDLDQQAIAIEAQVQQAREQQFGAEQLADGLKSQLGDARERIMELERQLSRETGRREEIEKLVGSAKAEVDQARADSQRTKDEYAKALAEEKSRFDASEKRLMERVATAELARERVEKMLAGKEKVFNEQLLQLQEKLMGVQKASAGWEAKCHAATAQAEAVGQQVIDKELQLLQAQEKRLAAEKDLCHWQSQAQAAEGHVKTLQHRFVDLEASLESKNQTLGELNGKVEHSQQQLKQLGKQLQQAENRAKDCETEKAGLLRSITELKTTKAKKGNKP